ncbi:MAG: Rrf2 family transcriptional regulator [Alphaproteobacteria bacterium]
MRLTTKGRYAVMAMADLARVHSGTPVALAEIAQRQDISLSYLEQLFSKLRKAKLVLASRGPGGGYRLSTPASKINIASIIKAVDEPIRTTRCEVESEFGCQGKQTRCLTHDLWFELGEQISLFLTAISLDDVVQGRVAGIAVTPTVLREEPQREVA